MIRLSSDQVMALQNEALHSFANRVATELPGYRGPLTAGRDHKTLYRTAIVAIDRAQSFGIETERALFLYVNLAVTLGAGFDSDPTLPWAHEILTDVSYLGDREKIDDLWNAHIDYCGAVMGEKGAFFPARAYRAFTDLPPPPREPPSLTAVLADFGRFWPEKRDALHPDEVHQMVAEAGARAADLGFRSDAARLRFCRIAFLIGYAFDADPMHDWAWPILRGAEGGASESATLDALEAGLQTHVILPALRWSDDPDDAGDTDARVSQTVAPPPLKEEV